MATVTQPGHRELKLAPSANGRAEEARVVAILWQKKKKKRKRERGMLEHLANDF